ncbi:MAG TPA: Calx-beta domain-containing protein, partial [Pyrinomonadaceae bacterium]
LNGGTLTGAGATDIPAGAALQLRGTQPTLARAVNNAGTANYAATSSMVFNGATFNNLAGGVFNVNSETLIFELGTPATFANAGTVRKGAGAGAAEFRLAFDNNGTVDLQSGELNFSARGTSAGAFNGAGGTTLRLAGQTLQASAAVAAPTLFLSGATAFGGALNVTGTTNVAGTATFTGSVVSAGQTLNVTGAGTFNSNAVSAQTVNVTGTLGGSADVGVPAGGTFNLTGGTLAPGGTTSIPAAATLNLGGAQPTIARTVNNAGTANYAPTGGMVLSGATFNNQSGAAFNVQSDTVLSQAGAGATFNNSGSLLKGAGAGAAEFRLAFTNAGAVTASAGTLHFSIGNYTQTAGETVLSGGGVQTTGLLDVQGGSLRGAGQITGNVRNAAAVRPGSSPGCMIVSGNYEQTAAATLDIEIGGATACTQYDRLQVTGAATLAGTLAATLINGFTPAAAEQFQVVTFASRTGQFSTVTGPLSAQHNATDVTLAATPSSTLVVTNTNDGGAGSLRQAILDANAQAGAQTVTFQIAGAGVRSIALLSPLPAITEAVQIDGSTQPGYAGAPVVELNGAAAGAGASGLVVAAGNSTVRALVVNRFAANGIVLQTNGGNTVAGCYVGTDAAGAAALANGQIGILVSSAGNTIGGTSAGARNVVSGNGNAGILISGAAATGNAVQGNYVGTDAAGTAAVANAFNGVQINNSAGSNTVGGTGPAARNVISGNGLNGVSVQAAGNTVQGNFIGTKADGASALANAANGLIVNNAGSNLIGGTAAGAGNVISGNTGAGVSLEINSTGNVVRGNLIGTNAAGAAAVPNGSAGVSIAFGSNANTVGGDDDDDGAADGAVAARNVISGNGGVGLSIQSASANTVQGNFVGVAADGLTAAGNGNIGVFVGASDNQIGGTAAGAGNLVAFNAGGVQVGAGAVNNAIRANLIHSNGGLGIDLQPAGVTPNDAGDADSGPNKLQNFPVLTSAVAAAGATQIAGTLNSAPNAAFAVEFFTNAACDASGSGEGQTLLGSAQFTTDAAGNAPLSFNLPAALPSGQSVTATATDAAGNTSEFSACRAVTGPPPATFSISGTAADPDGNPVGDVIVTLSGATNATTTTSSTGGYSFSNLAGGANYTVTPSLANFSFAPANRTYTSLAADQTAQNFTATPNPGTVQFSAANYAASESGGGIFVTLTRTGNTSGAATVNYADTPGTAAAADYSGGSGSVTFAAGEATKSFTVGVTDDALDEPDESFTLSLSVGAGNVVLGAQSTAAVTITDDDAAPSASVGDVTLAEGNSGQSNAVFQISLSAASGQAVTVNFATADGTATAASGDYAAQAGTATLPAGTTTFAVSVPVGGDAAVEPDETFFLNLTAPANAALGDAQGQATITNDDAAQTFSIAGRVTNSVNSQPLAAVAVTLSGGQGGTTQTDANGDYSFAGLAAGGTYTVTPSLANFSFAPLSRTFDNLQANQTADFAGGLASVVISGRITDENAQPAGGVTVALVAPVSDDSEQPLSTTQTDANGNYSFAAPVAGNYVVRPTRAGLIFTPPVHIFRNVTGNRTGDFRALDAFVISGNLTDLVAPTAKAGRAAPAADAGNVVVTLSGTRSGTTLTDAAGNYTFTNLPLGGTYRVTPQNPFNLFDPPFVGFANLAGDAKADFGADANPNPTPTPPIREDFTGAARDADKFSLGTLTQPPGATDPLVTVEQLGGKLVVTPRANFTGLSFNGYVTTRSVDFTNATADLRVDQIAAGGAQTIFSVGRDDQNFFRFVAQEVEVPAPAQPSASGDKARAGASNTLQQLLLQIRNAGVFNSLSIPYDPVAHKYWRFRHDAAAAPVPAMLFEVSPTGQDGTWTAVRIVPVAGALGSLATEISAGTAGAVASPGRAVFDDLNVTPAQTTVAVGAYRLTETAVSVAEGAGSFQLRVRRTGVLAAESTVDVASEPFDNRPCSTVDGKARPRCDFSTTFARLRFAAGEAEKTVTVFLTNDVYAEGPETFRLALGNASGGFSIDAAVATVTIRDDDQPGARNPINDADFFVRQQYLDFLSREPDAGGFEAWTGVLRRCAFEGHFGPGKSNSDPFCDRLLVSSSFYRSTEFHERGFFAYRFYEVALGRRPTYEEFLSDMQRLSGFQTEAEQEANKAAFIRDFMVRDGFGGRQSFADLNGRLDTPARLDQLLARGGVTLPNRDQLAADLAAGRATPAQVLRAVAESNEASARFYNRAFVAMQYFGYLQRDPEPTGYQAWLNHLNANPQDYRTMIFGFLYSQEYQSRFGPVQ